MSQGKKVDMTVPIDSVEDAVVRHDWKGARLAMAVRLARMLDSTDSARDVKALTMSLDPLIDKCESDSKTDDEATMNTPLAGILKMANG
jgi:hypothetical protein